MKRIDIDLAADYIVMASWLAFLKSKLLLPIEDDEDVSARELSAILAFRLRRLEAMREVGSKLLTRDREGVHVFRRGMPEPIFLIKNFNHKDTLFDLISSYSGLRNRNYNNEWKPRVFSIFSIEDARNRLEKMLGTAIDWTRIEDFLPINNDTTEEGILFRRSSLASIFSASLELSKEGVIEISQNKNFGDITIKEGTLVEPTKNFECIQFKDFMVIGARYYSNATNPGTDLIFAGNDRFKEFIIQEYDNHKNLLIEGSKFFRKDILDWLISKYKLKILKHRS